MAKWAKKVQGTNIMTLNECFYEHGLGSSIIVDGDKKQLILINE